MEVIFSTEFKVTNSTYQFKRPISLEGEIWGPCSAFAPVIRVSTGSRTMPQYKLARIPEFGDRWYFVDDMVYGDGFWEVHLSLDVLATYKEDIGTSVQFISRCQTEDLADGWLIDSKYPIKGRPQVLQNTVATGWATSAVRGCFVVGIYGPGAILGGVSYYIMTVAQMEDFQRILYETTDWLNPDLMGISADLAKGLINPMQYVESIRWFPYPPSFFTNINDPTNLVQIQLSWWTLDTTAYAITQRTYTDAFSIRIPRGTTHEYPYQRLEPYSSFILASNAFGEINIPANIIVSDETLDLSLDVDATTGLALLRISKIQLYKLFNFGVPVALSGRVTNRVDNPKATIASAAYDIGSNAITSIGNFFNDRINAARETLGLAPTSGEGGITNLFKPLKNFVGGNLNGITAVANTAMGNRENVNNVGSVGTFLSFTDPSIRLVGYFYDQVGKAPAIFGYPHMNQEVVSQFPGYIEIINPQLETIPATSTELSVISKYMETGFYYE